MQVKGSQAVDKRRLQCRRGGEFGRCLLVSASKTSDRGPVRGRGGKVSCGGACCVEEERSWFRCLRASAHGGLLPVFLGVALLYTGAAEMGCWQEG